MAIPLKGLHTVDPRQEIMDSVGAMADGFQILGTRVLIAVYVRPSKIELRGGTSLHLPDSTRDEDKFQGKAGLVLRLGPAAFTEDTAHRFGGVIPQPGDWVLFRVGDTFPFEMRSTDGARRCRVVEDVDVMAIVKEPDCVW